MSRSLPGRQWMAGSTFLAGGTVSVKIGNKIAKWFRMICSVEWKWEEMFRWGLGEKVGSRA